MAGTFDLLRSANKRPLQRPAGREQRPRVFALVRYDGINHKLETTR